MNLIRMPINEALATRWNQPSIADLVTAFGEQPDAVFDFESISFSATETRIVVVGYRNEDAWERGVPLPGLQKIELRLTRAEHLALLDETPAFATLEASVRDAAWSIMTTSPKLLRGSGEGENVFASGQLVEVD